MDDRRRVLELLAEGRITAEEAERLLDALGRSEPRGRAAPPPPPPPPPPPGPLAELPELIRGVVAQALGTTAEALGQARPEGARPVKVVSVRRGGRRVGRRPSFDELMQLAVHDIRPAYVRELLESGLDDLTIDDVIELAVHDVSPEYVRRVVRAAEERPSVDEIVRLAVHDVEPERWREFREALRRDEDDEEEEA